MMRYCIVATGRLDTFEIHPSLRTAQTDLSRMSLLEKTIALAVEAHCAPLPNTDPGSVKSTTSRFRLLR